MEVEFLKRDYRLGFFFENSTILLLVFCTGEISIRFSLNDGANWHCIQRFRIGVCGGV